MKYITALILFVFYSCKAQLLCDPLFLGTLHTFHNSYRYFELSNANNSSQVFASGITLQITDAITGEWLGDIDSPSEFLDVQASYIYNLSAFEGKEIYVSYVVPGNGYMGSIRSDDFVVGGENTYMVSTYLYPVEPGSWTFWGWQVYSAPINNRHANTIHLKNIYTDTFPGLVDLVIIDLSTGTWVETYYNSDPYVNIVSEQTVSFSIPVELVGHEVTVFFADPEYPAAIGQSSPPFIVGEGTMDAKLNYGSYPNSLNKEEDIFDVVGWHVTQYSFR